MDYANTNSLQNNITDESFGEILLLENKITSSNLPVTLKEDAMRNLERLKAMIKRGGYGPEFETIS